MNRLTQLRTYARLGAANLARVGAYRLGLRNGWHPVQRLTASVACLPFFRVAENRDELPEPNKAWDGSLWWFGWHQQPLPDEPPDWFVNPFSNAPQPDATHDWWRIADFGSGDIKGLWELSRLDWVVAWATTAAQGDTSALDRLNNWLTDWTTKNPPYKGPNWKCGQEASIRVMHLVTAAWVLGQARAPEPGLIDLVTTHLQRIAPTMSYAIGQQNNHGTSEAAALFIGGSFLAGHDPRANTWARKGRRWLEERATTLIEPDGSFSQYSVTYHRLTLDTYSLVEAWRRYCNLPVFSDQLMARLGAATDWLWAMTDAETGDAPNIGANDGARLLQLTDSDYRDFRPSVQLAAALFRGTDAFGPGPWTTPLRWLSVTKGKPTEPPSNISFEDGGYHLLRKGQAFAILRYPRFRFRPSQADALHIDLWHAGRNLLCDGGTFSYNAAGGEWFSSTLAHNTVIFDGRDQMPRLGRFLFGEWLRSDRVETVQTTGEMSIAGAGYTDSHGAQHHRRVSLTANSLICTDTLSGTFQKAELRWRLCPGEWVLDGTTLYDQGVSVSLQTKDEILAPILSTTFESRYYQQQSQVPLLSVTLRKPGQIITKVTF